MKIKTSPNRKSGGVRSGHYIVGAQSKANGEAGQRKQADIEGIMIRRSRLLIVCTGWREGCVAVGGLESCIPRDLHVLWLPAEGAWLNWSNREALPSSKQTQTGTNFDHPGSLIVRHRY